MFIFGRLVWIVWYAFKNPSDNSAVKVTKEEDNVQGCLERIVED
jgi:hypothetical protein